MITTLDARGLTLDEMLEEWEERLDGKRSGSGLRQCSMLTCLLEWWTANPDHLSDATQALPINSDCFARRMSQI
jgi:hypothetical protein